MWFETRPKKADWSTARRQLTRADATLARVISRVGPCTLAPRRDYFQSLCQAIFTQQVSMAVAAILFQRFRALLPNGRLTPAAVLGLTDPQLAAAGLSRQKQSYIRDLARHFATGLVPTRRLARMTDQQIVESLLPIKGVGRWTTEMFLIFVLNRPDVFPAADLGIRKAVQNLYDLPKLPEEPEILEIAEVWRPWRTVATWYLWKS